MGSVRCHGGELLLVARHCGGTGGARGAPACPLPEIPSPFYRSEHPVMSLSVLSLLSAGAAAPDGPPAWLQFAPFALILLVMWFMIGLPQMRQQKAVSYTHLTLPTNREV